MHAFSKLILGFLLLLVGTSAFAATDSEKRVALVIGNSAYQHTPSLPNPRNDAEDVGAALKRLGFEVVEGRDLTKQGMLENLARFARLAQGADAAVVFYAGHALQHRGENYLVPVDAKLEDEIGLDFQTLRVDEIVRGLDRARGVRMLILDACRNLPLSGGRSSGDVFSSRGLAKIGRRGMIVAYATQADDVAFDGPGRNSFFTGALVKELQVPGVEVSQLFRQVAISVNKQTSGKQTPELSLSFTGEFFFNRGETDRDVWQRVRSSADPNELLAFIARFPTSFLAEDAKDRIRAIERERRIEEMLAKLEDDRKGASKSAARQRADQERAARDAAERRAQDEDQRKVELAAREQKRLADERREAEEKAGWARLEEEQKRRAEAARKAEQERLARAKVDEAAQTRAEARRLEEERVREAAGRVARAAAERQRLADEKRLEEERRKDEFARRREQQRLAQGQAERDRLAEEERLLAAEFAARQNAARNTAAREQADAKRLEDEERQLAAEFAARQGADRERLSRELAERKQLEEEERELAATFAAGEKSDRARREDEQTRLAMLRPADPAKASDGATRALSVGRGGAPASGPVARLDGVSLIRAAQAELLRTGCYEGPVDGSLTIATRTALARYGKEIGLADPIDVVTEEILHRMRERKAPICRSE